jgi:RNA polymerase sigma-70 factor (sigma-E family)
VGWATAPAEPGPEQYLHPVTQIRDERHLGDVTFAEFATARLPALLRYAIALTGDRDLAQDVVQDSLAKAQANWRKVERANSPDAYVRQIVLNEYLSWRRRWSVRNIQAAGEHMVVLVDRRAATRDHADAVVDGEDLWARLATLPRKQRAVLVLRYYEQLDDTEIASLLDCAPATVRSNASKALKTLRLNLDRNHAQPRETSDV